MARKITIEFLGDSKDLQRAMDDAEGKSGRLSGTLKKVGKMAAVGLGVGVLAGGAALVKMTQGAIEDEAAQKKLEKQLQNSAGATKDQVDTVESWISAQGKATGVTDDELRPALGKLVTATGDVIKAQELARLAMDVSAGSGKSLEQVSTALMKAQNGQVSALSRLGINTKNAAGETIGMEEAVRRMGEQFGGQAAVQANTLQGKMDRLKLILSETGETIGSKLIPMVTVAADWFLNKGVPAVAAFGGYLQDKLGPIFETVKNVISNVMSGMQGNVSGKLGQIQSIFQSVTSIVTSLWDAFGATILDYAGKAFENLKTIVSGALTVVQGVFQTFAALLKGDWSGVWDGVKKILSGAWEVIKGIVRQAMNVVGTMMEIGWTVAKALAAAAWEGIKNLVSAGIGKVVDWVRDIPGKFSNALGGLKETVGGLFRDAMDAGKDKVTSIGQTIVGWIADIPSRLRDKLDSFKNAGSALIGGFVDGMKNAGGVIEGIAGNVWDAVKSLMNSAIDKINAALEFTISLPGPDITVNPANIPHLAKGGLVTKPTLALIGEDGPEAVVPLGKKNAPRGTMPMGGGGDTFIFHISGAVDPMGVGRQLEQILSAYTRNTGRPLQVATIGG